MFAHGAVKISRYFVVVGRTPEARNVVDVGRLHPKIMDLELVIGTLVKPRDAHRQ
jgi:hypothetical protein